MSMNPENLPFKKNKILVSLIHNNNQDRLLIIKPNIDKLIFELRKNNNVEFSEISWQPNLEPVSHKLGFFRDLMYWKLNREWTKYRENKNLFLIFDFFLFILRMIKKYIFNSNITRNWLQSCAIELFVSSKHINAYKIALENKADYLLVFEDDAIFKEESLNKLVGLSNNLEINDKSPIYIDLGGGCNFNELKIDNLELRRDKNFRYYKKPVTNTACCYLVNQEQLKLFNNYLVKNPILRYIGIDWLLNKMFIMQSKAGVVSTCFHADPHFFNHGSVTGQFKPWVR